MNTIDLAFGIIEIILAIVIIVLVLTQSKGADLGGFLGGGGGEAQVRTRRGVEALMHRVTIIFMVVFFINTLFTFFLWGF
ncbi:MAG: preprotein translocase subunit SecG [Anaerolineae bacterium]|nr:preprotein translocase subunit SecG [Anaerolineae bacterium]MCO5189431.1 preprotein translocase subunit SecG [Anaerolineae bacterium]MCO5195614.1 preprotein translocase subunit SecG [Anaerolineae bacterium]MCO5197301.1 preprotein translocase subunit SecG [Anaerolineae bacterium]MCO5204761.1 preprotein translocase subunit SecG [Anaerolineae bacterium]